MKSIGHGSVLSDVQRKGNTMTLEHTATMTVEQYFELEENNPDTRYKYIDGYVYMMSGGSANHAAISGNIYAILRGLLHQDRDLPQRAKKVGL